MSRDCDDGRAKMVSALGCPYFRRAFGWCVPIGGLGGLIGLGGGEFRLPVLMCAIGFDARSSVPLNLLTSLFTLARFGCPQPCHILVRRRAAPARDDRVARRRRGERSLWGKGRQSADERAAGAGRCRAARR